MYSIILLGILAHFSRAAVTGPRAGCEINPLQNTNSPLVIKTGASTFIYPVQRETTLTFAVDEVVDLVCPGRRIVVSGTQTEEVVQATCISDASFRILGERRSFTQVSCSGNAVATSRFIGTTTCESNGRRAEIGFSLSDGRFLRVIEVCYSVTAQRALYTYFDMPASIGNNAKGTPRPSFTQDAAFYNLGSQNVNQLYTRAVQRTTINKLLGLPDTSTKYVQDGALYYLSRGHMAARADFYYPAQQNATFRYINAAPQWQTFNELNWEEVEQSVRNYAFGNGVNLQVWTGVYAFTTLPHENSNAEVGLYLYVPSTGTTGLGVPAIYWKVVYNPANRRGVALIGLNNPYETNVSKYVVCPDVSNSLNWLSWNKNNITRGYSYACTVPNLRSVVSYAPNISVSGLLV